MPDNNPILVDIIIKASRWVVMAKKQNKKSNANNTKSKEKDQFKEIESKLPKDAQKKVKAIKSKLDKFQKAVLKKFENYIIGIALLPPKKPE
ncbi:MAG TPA: hypothetical protein ENL45_01880, partial [Candidatus Woesearchaeota archaeon]|nr:hypothetical protein [Candidatus Woesearchaeota archaeon]